MYIPIISALEGLSQKDEKFAVCLRYIESSKPVQTKRLNALLIIMQSLTTFCIVVKQNKSCKLSVRVEEL